MPFAKSVLLRLPIEKWLAVPVIYFEIISD